LPVVPPVTDAPVKILMMSLLPSRKMPLRVSVTDTGLTVILRLFASAKKPSGSFWLFTTPIQVTDALLPGVPGTHALFCAAAGPVAPIMAIANVARRRQSDTRSGKSLHRIRYAIRAAAAHRLTCLEPGDAQSEPQPLSSPINACASRCAS